MPVTPAAQEATPPVPMPAVAEPTATSAAPGPVGQASDLPRKNRRSSPSAQQTAPADYAAPAQEPQPPQQTAIPVDTAALDELRDRLGALAPRANALRGALTNLEKQQQAMGVGLRLDIKTSWHRLESLLDEAEAGLKAGSVARAQKSLDAAEKEADKLDSFLGH
jgi:hypothetical protein